MPTQRAIIVQEAGRATLVHDAPVPELPDDYILIKTKAGIAPDPIIPKASAKTCSSCVESHGLAAYRLCLLQWRNRGLRLRRDS